MEASRKPPRRLPGVFTSAPQWLNMYGDFIIKNASAVAQIESSLRSLTYIIPGRFRESELASESLHSAVQLLSLYHDTLLAKAVARLPPLQRPHPSPHNRYTKFWIRKSPIYRRIATFLQVIQYTELLTEMAAKRKGERVRWRVVVFLEIVKALCRLLLLRLTNSRPLLSPPLPEREVDPSTIEDSSKMQSQSHNSDDSNGHPTQPGEGNTHSSSASNASSAYSDDTKWTMPRTGLSLPSLPNSSDISSYLLSKVLTADDVKPPKALLHRVTGKGEFAEILYILRPVIYALAMLRWGTADADSKRNWRPWLLGFGIEFGARQLAKRDVAERFAGGLRGLTGLEREELRKRGWSLGWWVMRGAFYENVTRTWVKSLADKFRGKMLIDLVATVIDDYDFLWDQYYFPTATL